MKKSIHSISLGAVASLVLSAASVNAAVIYNETFSGAGADPLNGSSPDTGANQWVASSDWKADGSIAGSTSADGKDDDSAFLSFTPTSGNVYTLSAVVSQPTSGQQDTSWMAIGFTADNVTGNHTSNAGFFSSPNNASPWMLYRRNAEVKTFDGPGTSGTNISEGNFGGGLTMSIELDTTATQWSAEWFVNGSSVRSKVFVSNPIITNVGFGREDGVTSTISSFSLTTAAVPEPSSAALIGLGGLVLILRRRK